MESIYDEVAEILKLVFFVQNIGRFYVITLNLNPTCVDRKSVFFNYQYILYQLVNLLIEKRPILPLKSD